MTAKKASEHSLLSCTKLSKLHFMENSAFRISYHIYLSHYDSILPKLVRNFFIRIYMYNINFIYHSTIISLLFMHFLSKPALYHKVWFDRWRQAWRKNIVVKRWVVMMISIQNYSYIIVRVLWSKLKKILKVLSY